ncbi:ABC transporter permease [Azospirillum sp. B506]|uniref:ABC transporter permease n=1 Tax=Azospirillum sp. B506 TaxID=137721 RepID=UPI00034C11AE|nr:ABC transporter permease [Azospirillum sp. B506]
MSDPTGDEATNPYRTSLRSAVDWGLVAIGLPILAGLAFPIAERSGESVGWFDGTAAPFFLVGLVLAVIAAAFAPKRVWGAWVELAGIAFAWLLPVHLMNGGLMLSDAWGLWLFLLGTMLLLWRVMAVLAGVPGWTRSVLVPGLFGLGLLVGWEFLVTGFEVPAILLPAPSRILVAIIHHAPVLWEDFRQTVLTSVLRGYAMGCAAGFLVAILADRVPFLARGLLPLGNLASAIPVVGIAPIMVMWFGFDWQSKAAVIVVMTFFPMLINTLAGLGNSERIQLDLMRSYAAGYGRTLVKLRLPNALPFLFNGLKINSTLALIGAIVAEFFGTPVVGMGFRISTEVARMNLDIVWATIAVAALTGSGLYGALALLERVTTAWHPSMRQR